MTRPQFAPEPSDTPDGVEVPGTPVEDAQQSPVRQHAASCSGCPARWSGFAVAHCRACHHTFAGVTLFDLHRDKRGDHGSCLDPEQVTSFAGDRVMFLRGGMWRGPEMTEAQKAARFGDRP